MGEGVVKNPDNNASNFKHLLKGYKCNGDALLNAVAYFLSHSNVSFKKTVTHLLLDAVASV